MTTENCIAIRSYSEDEEYLIVLGATTAAQFRAAVAAAGLIREHGRTDGYEHDEPLQAYIVKREDEEHGFAWDCEASADTPGAQLGMVATAYWVEADEHGEKPDSASMAAEALALALGRVLHPAMHQCYIDALANLQTGKKPEKKRASEVLHELHNQIMNLPIGVFGSGIGDIGIAYQSGHAAARHSAASLVTQAQFDLTNVDADTQRHIAVGKAIERACEELPNGAGIVISLEKGSGSVEMVDWDGNEFDHYDEIEDFAQRINAATDGAIAAEQVAAQAKQGGE